MIYKIINTNRFYLKGTNERFLHLITFSKGFKEYCHFIDRWTGQGYVEEMTTGQPRRIENEEEFDDVVSFLEEHGFLQLENPMLADEYWRKNPTGKKYFIR